VEPAVKGHSIAPLPEVVATPIVGVCGTVVAVIEPAEVDVPLVAVALVAVTAIE
jgi:hypothetical protein